MQSALMSSSIYKYVDLCSTYRSRSQYPNPANFVVPVEFGPGNALNVFQAKDPVSNAFPTVVSTTQAGSTTTAIVLNASSSPIDDFYVGDYLQIGTEYRIITSYVAATQTATVQTAFSVAPAGVTQYYIRQAIPVYSSTLAAGSTQNLVNLGIGALNRDSFYVGMFIYFRSGANIGVSSPIAQYNGTTLVATLGKPLPFLPAAGDAYDILPYSYDSYCPLIYSGTIGFNQPVCYSIELLYLTIPNQPIKSGYGGNLNNYPFLYLYLFNEGNMHADKVLYTNNPNAQSCLFKIPLGLNLRTETFFTLKDAKMINVCKFKLDQPIRFQLVLPNGEPIIFATADNMSPAPPNPLLQISGVFAYRRIDAGTTQTLPTAQEPKFPSVSTSRKSASSSHPKIKEIQSLDDDDDYN